MIGHRLATAPRGTLPHAQEWLVSFGGRKVQLLQARSDGGPCEPGRLGDPDDPTPAKRSSLNSGPDAADPLIEKRFKSDIFRFDELSEWVGHGSNCNNRQVETGNLFWRAASGRRTSALDTCVPLNKA